MIITTLSELQRDFNSKLEKANNKEFIISNEIEQVTNYVNTVPAVRGIFKKPIKPTFISKPRRVFNLKISGISMPLFNEAFYEYMYQGECKIELNSDNNDTFLHNKSIVKQAFEFVEYYKWLKQLQITPQSSTKKNSSLTHKQKLLALHYLGLDISNYDNTKIAKILSEILELNEDNTRQYLSYLSAGKNDVRTKNNLEKAYQLFENQGLSEISTTIKKDLEKL